MNNKIVTPGDWGATQYKAILTASSADGMCSKSTELTISVNPPPPNSCGFTVTFGSQAHVASGNLSHSQELFTTRGGSLPVGLTLYYNSLDPRNGSLGQSWSHNYEISARENLDGSVLISEGNWQYRYFTLTNGTYLPQSGDYSTLAKKSDNTFTLILKDGTRYDFGSAGMIASITDRNNNALTFSYTDGNLTSIADPAGRSTTLSHDSADHITSIVDPLGTTHYLSYNNDQLATVISQDTQLTTHSWSYTYAANGFLLSKTDPLNSTTTYAYDSKHRVVSSIDPEGTGRSISYPQSDETVKSSTFIEKDGGVWSYTYDTKKGVLTSKTDPQGGVTSYSYDAAGNRTSTTLPDGTSSSATFDQSGNMLTSTDAMGQTSNYTYNSFGQVLGITDPAGAVTAYSYDANGNMTSITDRAGATTRYDYDVKGNVIRITNPLGQATSFVYDTRGNLASITDPGGVTSSYGYDAAGNMTSQTDAGGATTRFEYDNRNRLLKKTDPQGNSTLYSYDANGNKLSETDGNGNQTKYEYNSQNQLVRSIDPLDNITSYAYGSSGCPSCNGGGDKLVSLTDANNNVTSYSYDQLGRLIRETDPKGDETGYSYDAKGNLITRIDGNGNTINYSYDGINLLLKKTYPDNTEVSYSYDARGNTLTATNRDISYSFSYDAAGRLLSSTDSNGRVVQYAYDVIGRKSRATYPDGSLVSYAYDTVGRLASITNGSGRTYSYSYDDLGRRTILAYPNGATANYSYDSRGNLINLTHKTSTNKIIDSFSYTHDKVGNRLNKAEPEVTWSYGYDSIYRLLQALPTKQHGKDKEQEYKGESYSYDPVGNRLFGPRKHAAYAYGAGNELLADGNSLYSYDRNGNLVAKSNRKQEHGDHHDDEGKDEDKGKEWSYTYDFENRLIKAETKHEGENLVVSFKYDPFGRRIEKKVEKSEHGKREEAKTYTYVYDDQSIILEYETKVDDGRRKTRITKYIHGPGIDQPLSLQRENEVYYYHADGLGSVVELTDKRQKVVESYEYDSFGNLRQHEQNILQPFTYTGREWDRETRLLYLRYRYYDPMDGRFISKDPIGFEGGDVNLYGYVQNNSVNKIDQFGLADGWPTTGGWPWNGSPMPGYKRQDNVCSIEGSFGDYLNNNSCTKRCCIDHDNCYKMFGCNAWSWAGSPYIIPGPCQLCNIRLSACILTNLY